MIQQNVRHLIAAAVAAIMVFPLESRAGTDAAAFLSSGIGARAMGMGGAFVSLADDPTAMYWNPAGLGKIRHISINATGQSISAGEWETLKDIAPTNQFVGITLPVRSFSLPGINNAINTFGIGVVNSSLSRIPYTSVDGNGRIVRDTFEDSENAYFLSYGIPVIENDKDQLYAGVSLRYITQQFSKIADASATGYDMGAGVIYNFGTASAGLSLERGAEVKWANGHTDTSPMTTKLGIANKFALYRSLSLLGALDVVQRQGQPIQVNLGTELGYEDILKNKVLSVNGIYLRAGIDSYVIENRYDYRDLMNNQLNLNAGLGLALSLMGYWMELDYVLGSYRLGNTSRLSISLYI